MEMGLDLILNKYIFTEGVQYLSRTQSVHIEIHNDTDVTLTRLVNGFATYSWFGYTLDSGKYVLSFDILSTSDIVNPFLKLHNPVIFYTTDPIKANVLKSIRVTLTVKHPSTLLAFIFDHYPGCVTIQFTNIKIEKVTIPLDLNVIVRGHFRTFDTTHESLRKSLSNTTHKIFMHTWDTIDANTPSWHGNVVCNTNMLDKPKLDLLRSFDEGCIIESQTWTDEELKAIVLSRPYKTFLYFWQGIHESLYRIQEESRYILITRYDVDIKVDFASVACEEDEIVIGYAHRYPNNVFAYGFTDLVFLIHYNDMHKLLSIPQNILDLDTNIDPRYKIAEDPITDFFYSSWKKVTPRWLGTRDIGIVRQVAS